MYIKSATCIHLGHQDCSYTYFVQIWALQCPHHVKLKSSMRFTKCDTCTLANAALDRLRIHGGPEWRTSEAGPIERLVGDHHKVRRPSYRVVSSLLVFFSSLSWSPLVRYFDWHNTFFLKAIPRIAGVVALIFPPFRCRVCSPQDITGSRGFHMDRKQIAIATPHKLLCVAIDGSDQSSYYALPFFPQVGVSVSATVSFVALSASFMSMRLLKAVYFRICVV